MNIDTTKIRLMLEYPGEGEWVTVERKCDNDFDSNPNDYGNAARGLGIHCVGGTLYYGSGQNLGYHCGKCLGKGFVPVECRMRVEVHYNDAFSPGHPQIWFDDFGEFNGTKYIAHLLSRFAAGEDVAGIEVKE